MTAKTGNNYISGGTIRDSGEITTPKFGIFDDDELDHIRLAK